MTDTYAWRAASEDPWLEVGADTVLPRHPPGAARGAVGWRVSLAFVASFDDAWRAQHGFAAIVRTDPPVGVRVLGSSLEDVDGVPTETWASEAFSEGEIASLRGAALLAVKSEARRRILGRYPDWRQANMTARAAELLDFRMDRELTEDEEAERLALKAAKAWVDSVRAASNDIEALVPADAAGIAAFDVIGHAGWPS